MMPNCPNCDEELDLIDTYDIDVDGDFVFLKECGNCPKCGARYRWEDEFVLESFSRLEKVT